METLAMAGGLWHEHWPAIVLLLILLAIAAHEMGHLLAGWLAGFRFNSIQIGPLSLENEYGVLKPRLSLDMMALGYAGMHANSVRKLRRRLLIYIAGGPCANLICVIAIALIGNLMPPSNSAFATATGQFAAISLVFALISLTPIATTDGGLIEMLLCSPLAARRFMSTVALGAQFRRGIRARDWRQTWIDAATCIPDKSPGDFYASWMAYLAADDRRDAPVSAQYLERCLSLTPLLTIRLRSLVAQEAFVYFAWYKQDSILAAKWLAQVKKRSSSSPIIDARIKIASFCAQGDFDNAAVACDKALALFEQMPVKPYVQALQESWIEWRAEITERKVQTPTSRQTQELPTLD